jgi:hypothetical protein
VSYVSFLNEQLRRIAILPHVGRPRTKTRIQEYAQTAVCLAAELTAAISLDARIIVNMSRRIATGAVIIESARLGGERSRTICWSFSFP